MAVEFIEANPGVQAFQGQQLHALLVLLLAEKNGIVLPDELSTLVDDTNCLRCLSDSQLEERLVSLLWTDQEDGSTADELMVKINCLNCVDPKTIKAMTNFLLGELLT